MFDELFCQPFESAALYLKDPDNFMDQTMKLPSVQCMETLRSVKKALVDRRPIDFQGCVNFARIHFQQEYYNVIQPHLAARPPDVEDSSGNLSFIYIYLLFLTIHFMFYDTGLRYWSGTKRRPRLLIFDVNKKIHLDYIVAVANLKAQIYGIPQCFSREVSLNIKIAFV